MWSMWFRVNTLIFAYVNCLKYCTNLEAPHPKQKFRWSKADICKSDKPSIIIIIIKADIPAFSVISWSILLASA